MEYNFGIFYYCILVLLIAFCIMNRILNTWQMEDHYEMLVSMDVYRKERPLRLEDFSVKLIIDHRLYIYTQINTLFFHWPYIPASIMVTFFRLSIMLTLFLWILSQLNDFLIVIFFKNLNFNALSNSILRF